MTAPRYGESDLSLRVREGRIRLWHRIATDDHVHPSANPLGIAIRCIESTCAPRATPSDPAQPITFEEETDRINQDVPDEIELRSATLEPGAGPGLDLEPQLEKKGDD